jgi:hypothetical protein
MADDNGHIAQTLEDIKAQIAEKLAEAARLLPTANHLAEMIGAAAVTLSDFLDDMDGQATPASAQGGGRVVPAPTGRGAARHIKPDTFLGKPPLDAAKQYLGMVGHAVHIDDIANAVERGGAAVRGDWRAPLEMGLIRSTHDVIKVQENTYGLVSFYSAAQVAGLRGARRRPEKTKGKRATKGGKGGQGKKGTQKAQAETKPSKEAQKESAPASSAPEPAGIH